MTITKIDRRTIGDLQTQFVTELQDVAKRLGLEVTNGGGTYSNGDRGTVKIDVVVKAAPGQMDVAEKEFRQLAGWRGIDPDAFGKVVICNGTTYTICGANPNAPKYCIQGRRHDGKIFGLTADTVRRHYSARKTA